MIGGVCLIEIGLGVGLEGVVVDVVGEGVEDGKGGGIGLVVFGCGGDEGGE